MNTDFNLVLYAIYVPVTLALTVFTAHKLFKSSIAFMHDIFRGNEVIAKATNELFRLGFYLLNIGFALNIMYVYSVKDTTALIEKLSSKVGGFSIYLGLILMLHLVLFLRGRKNARRRQLEATTPKA